MQNICPKHILIEVKISTCNGFMHTLDTNTCIVYGKSIFKSYANALQKHCFRCAKAMLLEPKSIALQVLNLWFRKTQA